MVYGCDICQKVCPKNTGVNFKDHPEFEPSGIENINLIDVLEMSNKEYMDMYGRNASSWKGPLVIKRNALCVLGNQGLKNTIPIIKKSMDKYSNVLWYNKTALKVINILESK
jgi:epoxyqueuosine reductase